LTWRRSNAARIDDPPRGSAAPPQSTYLSLDDLAQAEREYRAALRIAPGARCGMSRVMFAEP